MKEFKIRVHNDAFYKGSDYVPYLDISMEDNAKLLNAKIKNELNTFQNLQIGASVRFEIFYKKVGENLFEMY